MYDPDTMKILGGNMRYRALAALGYDEIPEDFAKPATDFTEEEKRRFRVNGKVWY